MLREQGGVRILGCMWAGAGLSKCFSDLRLFALGQLTLSRGGQLGDDPR